MRKLISILVATVLATLAVGCASNTKNIGTIGGVNFYRVKSRDFTGPNFTSLVAERDGHVAVVETFGGPGIGASVISAVGQVGASAVLGTSFPRIPRNVGDNINVSANAHDTVLNHNINQSASSATGGSASSSSAASGTGAATGGTHTHPASPGNGGIPGNGGQNGNGNN